MLKLTWPRYTTSLWQWIFSVNHMLKVTWPRYTMSPSSSRLPFFFQQRPCPWTRKSLQNNSNNKLIEEKINDSFLILEEHFFAIILVQKKLMKFKLKTYCMKFSSSSQNHRVSVKRFVHTKVCHCKLILIISLVQTYILKVT
jgi:hypothetical protein